ncbi:post-GPI attachment to proteins factor 2 [Elysia marginata]|uniref:Post-GPI attachment to proteins factor 2 n=1 Tax=Elysia marginata TaxID=1093978 RepID=A0AAV4FP09_9GAST|nr:post-GPI attachment to proteins factor 2 [Elysia marginata]
MFVTFMVSGLLCMMLTITLFSWRHRFITPSAKESKSLWLKQRLFGVNISVFLSSIYLFFRHTWYCEPGVYTAFAACEYIVVLTNIGFHSTLMWDFDTFSMACVSKDLVANSSSRQKANNEKLD